MAEVLTAKDYAEKLGSDKGLTKQVKTMQQINNIVEGVNLLLDKLGTLKQKGTPLTPTSTPQGDNINTVDVKPIPHETPKQMYLDITKAYSDLLIMLRALAKENPEKTIKEYVDGDIKALDDNGLLKPMVENWIKKYIVIK